MEPLEIQIDAGIQNAVDTLRAAGIETFESCEGGNGHAFTEPTVRFHGDRTEGYKAVSVALRSGLEVSDLRRIWTIIEGELTGPFWELVFYKP